MIIYSIFKNIYNLKILLIFQIKHFMLYNLNLKYIKKYIIKNHNKYIILQFLILNFKF